MGKERAAIAFAMACNCTADRPFSETESPNARNPDGPAAAFRPLPLAPCGVCKSCRKIETGSHPDILRVKPSGSFIKIDQIRSLCQTLAMKPYEARLRVVIISDAQAMNPAAGNALLKALEEPPARTILILVAAHPSDLMPTIVSRCQHIRFNPLSRKTLESLLVGDHGLEAGDAAVITAMANGSLSRALRLYRDNWINRRRWLINELNSLSNGGINRLLAFSDQLSKNKEDLPEALEIIKSWFRDLVVAKLYPDKILNHDLAPKLRQASPQMSQSSLLAKLEIIQSAQHSIQAGTNLRLSMEAMVLKLSRL